MVLSTGAVGLVMRLMRNIAVYFVLSFVVTFPAQGKPISVAEVAALLEQGDEARAQGRWDDALSFYSKTVKANPNDAAVLNKLAGIYLLKGQYVMAARHFQKVIGLNSTDATAFVGMALAYLHIGRYSSAQAALEEAKRLAGGKTTEDIDRVLSWIKARRE